MVKNITSPTLSQHSVKNGAKPLKGPYFEFADCADESNVSISPNGNLSAREKLASQSAEILSTSDLISVVGQVWDCANRSLAHLQPKANFGSSGTISEKDNDSRYLVGNSSFCVIDFIDSRCLQVDLNTSSYFSCIVQQSLAFTRTARRMRCDLFNDDVIENSIRQSGDDFLIKHDILLKRKSLKDIETLPLMNRYELMGQISLWPKPPMFKSEAKRVVEAFIFKAPNCHDRLLSGNDVCSSHARTQNLDTCINTPNLKNLSYGGSNEVLMLWKESLSFYTYNILHRSPNKIFEASLSTALSFGLHLDDYVSTSAPECAHEANPLDIEDGQLLENEMIQCEEFSTHDVHVHQSERCSPITNKPHPLLAKQEHAVSGALAGIFVSLCLHPVDTVKTIVQSCHPGQKSIFHIGQSILSERGVPGLYRGITSNVTTSAPISAIYTFTYESMKEFLLPSLTKEYHSVAHCTAGASASIATSFVFTPSERIKQQMQVNSKYHNCWNAVQRIIETGGLRSLYAGWGAVLCRNIPHSIIKFYTYESLKQMLMSSQVSQLPNKQPTTLQTLVCGGLAGSTAALVSTPFDVVKTRLQTQMPGSMQKYHSILNALQDIREREGVRGLYRGLIPRLAMYMSQGALFFASYEFLKTLLSLELRQNKSEMLQHKQDGNDDPLLSS